MHDIICPRCGEKYIARDVAFDISEYVTDLLYDNRTGDRNDVLEVNFKYYIDEETIENTHVPESGNTLACNAAAGPSGDWTWYECKITKKVLWDYVEEKSNMTHTFKIGELVDRLHQGIINGTANNAPGAGARTRQRAGGAAAQNETTAAPAENTAPATQNAITDAEKRNFILACRLLFDHTSFEAKLDKDGRITSDALSSFHNDNIVKTAIKILHYLKNSTASTDCVILPVATFSRQEAYGARYAIPDNLFIKDAQIVRKQKICRYCGYQLPDEFGYYPIKTVVVLGSHNAGKTSFLVSLYHTVLTMAPFAHNAFGQNQGLDCSTLSNDEDTRKWNTQRERFVQACRMEQTSFDRQPVLNIKVRKQGTKEFTIYSFVDWAGEAFITNNPNATRFDPLRYQKLFRWTRHLMMFLEPTQISSQIPANTNNNANVSFSIFALVEELKTHLGDLIGGKLKTLTYILCQADRLEMLPAGERLWQKMAQTPNNSIYANGQWNDNPLEALQNESVAFLDSTNQNILNTLAGATAGTSLDKLSLNYIPVAPYGRNVDAVFNAGNIGMSDGQQVVQSRCVGVPFLMFLHKDGII